MALGSILGERKGWSISPSAPSAQERKEAAEAKEEAEAAEDDGSVRSCMQKCGLKRSDCGHPCAAQCHPGQPCPTNVACKESVRIYCDCKRLSKIVPCGQEGGIGLRALSCTAQCEVETRNARFRDALQLDDSTPRIPYPAELLEQVIALDQFEFVVRMERQLEQFLGLTGSANKTFGIMPTAQRWVLHQLSSYFNMDSESFDPEPRRSVRVIKSAVSLLPKMKLSDAVKLYRDAKAGKGGATPAKVTLAPSTVIHLFDLDQEPRISASDLALALKPYSLDYNGDRNHNFRTNWLDHSHALIVFQDAQLATNIRANLVARKLFALEPDELASKKAAQAWREQYQNNGLFRRRHETGGIASAKKLTAASSTPSSSSFDDWSSARNSSSSSKTAASSEAAAPTAAAASSWDSAVNEQTYQSDQMSEADFNALLERSKRESEQPASSMSAPAASAPSAAAAAASLPSASTASASSMLSAFSSMASSAGSVSFGHSKRVATANAWGALNDEEDDEEDNEGDDDAEQPSTRKQRRRAAAAAAASTSNASPAASADDSAWEDLASSSNKNRKTNDDLAAPAAKSAFDD